MYPNDPRSEPRKSPFNLRLCLTCDERLMISGNVSVDSWRTNLRGYAPHSLQSRVNMELS